MGILYYWLRRGDLNLRLPSCGAQNQRALLLVADDFDHYANKRSLPRPQDAVACVAPGTRRSGAKPSDIKNTEHRLVFCIYWLRRGDLMGSAHHSLREHPIMFAFGEGRFKSPKFNINKK